MHGKTVIVCCLNSICHGTAEHIIIDRSELYVVRFCLHKMKNAFPYCILQTRMTLSDLCRDYAIFVRHRCGYLRACDACVFTMKRKITIKKHWNGSHLIIWIWSPLRSMHTMDIYIYMLSGSRSSKHLKIEWKISVSKPHFVWPHYTRTKISRFSEN